MIEIVNEEAAFRLSFIEKIEEPEERRLDLIKCWLEIKDSSISLSCQCDLTLLDLDDFRHGLTTFYADLLNGIAPKDYYFEPREPVLRLEVLKVRDADYCGLNFIVRPDLTDGWTLHGGIAIDQSYFPSLLQGIDALLNA